MTLHSQELKERMEAFAAHARAIVALCDNEEQTKISLINPYLELLGYNVRDPRHVRLEVRSGFQRESERVDYEVLHDGEPRILIEAKKATASLGDDGRPTGQIQRYAMAPQAQSVQYAVYTNGRIWRWFRKDAGKQMLEQQPFLEHDVTEPEDRELRWLATIHNAAFSEEAAARTADEESLQSAFALWYRKCRDTPPQPFLKLLLNTLGHSATKGMLDRADAAWRAMLAAERAELLSEASRRIRGSAQASPETAPAPAPYGARDDAETRGPTRREETEISGPGTGGAGPAAAPRAGEETPRGAIRPSAFRLDGQRYGVRNWPQLLTTLCTALAETAGTARFAEKTLPLRGRSRPYFSLSRDALRKPLAIPGTNLYVEGNHSAASAEQLARRILQEVRGTENGFQIEYRE